MDRSLDEMITDRPRQNRPGRGRSSFTRSGVKKSYRTERVDLDLDWVHDKFEDDIETRPYHDTRSRRVKRHSPEPERAPAGAKLRVDNLHYDLTEDDLEGLFTRIGPISSLHIRYDRAGRSEGIAFVTYRYTSDARTAIHEFDGANAKGQPIRLTLLPQSGGRRGGRNPFGSVEQPKGSLFDRVERPRNGSERSPSQESESESTGGGPRRHGRYRGRNRRSDVSKPPPDHIDRYVPDQRSPLRREGAGRRLGQRREERRIGNGQDRRLVNGRPRKTQAELDQEMEDYWGSANADADRDAVPEAPKQIIAPFSTAVTGDDDIDMVE